MSLTWDTQGTHYYNNGVDHGVLFVFDSTTGKYGTGVAWNGLTAVNEQPSGAEPTTVWADNIKYLTLMSAEEYKFTIEALDAPDAFAACDGRATISLGNSDTGEIGQQTRKVFAFSYRTRVGSDTDGAVKSYKIHYVFGCLASPAEMNHQTVNDSPEAASLSWSVSSTPITVNGKTFSTLTIDDADGTYDNSVIPDALGLQ